MTFSKEWDELYQSGLGTNEWPFSDIVSLTCRYVGKQSLKNLKVLELGCGFGPNIGFFSKAGASYFAMEGSNSAVQSVHFLFPEFVSSVLEYDFSKQWPFPNDFDLIIDRSSVTHNSLSDIKSILKQVRENLKQGGWYIGVDWFGIDHGDRKYGKKNEDEYTYSDFKEGQFKGCGRVHFSDEAHIRQLLNPLDILYLENRIASISCEASSLIIKRHTFNFVAQKKD